MHLRPLRADDGILIKRVRLRSLADAPYAFGPGSFAEESALPDSHWHQRSGVRGWKLVVGDSERRCRMTSAPQLPTTNPQPLPLQDRCAAWVVLDGEEPCGTATCYLCPTTAGRAYITGAWIDPRYRRRGLGRGLVEAAIAWAASRGAGALRLWVDDTNPSACEFYRSLGFIPTGESQPMSEGASERQSGFERRVGEG